MVELEWSLEERTRGPVCSTSEFIMIVIFAMTTSNGGKHWNMAEWHHESQRKATHHLLESGKGISSLYCYLLCTSLIKVVQGCFLCRLKVGESSSLGTNS